MTDEPDDLEDRVRAFVAQHLSDCEHMAADADLFDTLGVAGDDCSEFMEAFAEEFEIDMMRYLWYFHHEEEGFLSIGGLFFKPPNQRVSPIPITIGRLAQAVRSQTWPIVYPHHVLPETRWDLRINAFLLWIVGCLLAATLIYRFVGFLIS